MAARLPQMPMYTECIRMTRRIFVTLFTLLCLSTHFGRFDAPGSTNSRRRFSYDLRVINSLSEELSPFVQNPRAYHHTVLP